MSRNSSKVSQIRGGRSEKEDECVVCFRPAIIYSIGECDHPVCHECSTRMRVLCRRNECPICRKDMALVVFLRKVQPFSKVDYRLMKYERRYAIYFESDNIMKSYDSLLEHVCTYCQPRGYFSSFDLLENHMKKQHELFYCNLCTKHLKIFTKERRCYNRVQLGMHRRRGDDDDKSHKGHPLCEYCDDRFLDNDDLFRHLRREHYFCHFCDADGATYQFYGDYDGLREHFKSSHFLCEEGNCYIEKFTSVFRTKLDLQAHLAKEHLNSISKSEARQARTVDIAFTVNHRQGQFLDRNRGGGRGGRRGGRRDQQDVDDQALAASALPPSLELTKQQDIDINCVQDFPSLGGSKGSNITASDSGSGSKKSIAQKLAHQNRFTVRTAKGKALTEEDFPSLTPSSGNADDTPTPAIHLRLNTKKNDIVSGTTKGTNVSIKYNRSNAPQMPLGGATVVPPPKPRVGSISHSENITFKNNLGKNPYSSDDFPSLTTKTNIENPTTWVTALPQAPQPPDKSKVNNQLKKGNKTNDNDVKKDKGAKPKELFLEQDFPSLPQNAETKPLNYVGRTSLNIPVRQAFNNEVDVYGSDDTGSKNRKKKKAIAKSNNNENNTPATAVTAPAAKSKKKIININNNYEEGDSDGPHEDLSWGRLGEYQSSVPGQSSNISVMKVDNPSVKKSELQIGMLQAPKLNSEEFPSLGGLSSGNKNTNSSWGAKTNKRSSMPAEFSNKSRNSATPKFADTHMTFTSSSGQTFSISPSTESPTCKSSSPLKELSSQLNCIPALANKEFILPPNFQSRNNALIDTVNDVCNGNQDKFDKFKKLAQLLRKGEMTGQDYYKQCRQVMGKNSFHCILPELLTLLPDISKQQAVLEAYKKMDGGKGCSTSFAVCAGCRQVLRSEDFSHHMDSHNEHIFYPPILNDAARKRPY